MTADVAAAGPGNAPQRVRYRVTGMDCAHDAAEIEEAASGVSGLASVKVSVASQIMTAEVLPEAIASVERAVRAVGYQIDRIDAAAGADGVSAGPPAVAPAYRRALWIVVILNAGYGVIEAVGGFLSGSQALKADALDFLGDGLISFLGLLALSWHLRRRAQAALLQGFFLGALGVGVLVNTAYRVLVQQQPEAELMGAFALVALVVNVAAAAVLMPHRKTGDANARAIWLFSRNDALGNLAVVLAAGLVAWTNTSWPDLIVAVVIAGLFLQSSWSIVRDARSDLEDAHA
jgi:Co/Zn/Cd efflux system component